MTEQKRQESKDEADSIRRMSRGDSMTAEGGGSISKASIEGSFWIAIVALVGVIFVGIIAGYVLGFRSARDDDVAARLGVLGSRISVLEYDSARMCAQLLEQDLIEACH